jgi:hypothetical protein
MNQKHIDGSVASYLTQAVEHLTNINASMNALRHKLHHTPADNFEQFAADEIWRHTTKFRHSLEMLRHCLKHMERADQ